LSPLSSLIKSRSINRWTWLLLLVFSFFLLENCGRKHPSTVAIRGTYLFSYNEDLGFYSADEEYTDSLGLQSYYLKVADIGWNDVYNAYPLVKRGLNHLNYAHVSHIVPVVYIENQVFEKANEAQLDVFVSKLSEMIHTYENLSDSIQFDCDWTESTKGNYFSFIEKYKLANPTTWTSVTLRLYPFKYREKCGIPPVDEAFLMMYHTSKTRTMNEQNSIFSQEDAEEYFRNASAYPLPINLALPYFGWIKVEQSNQEFFLMNPDEIRYPESQEWMAKGENGIYNVIRDTLYSEHYFRRGDILKFENTYDSQLKEAAETASQAINQDTTEVILYDLSFLLKQRPKPYIINDVYQSIEN
jgi:hypothetical protein